METNDSENLLIYQDIFEQFDGLLSKHIGRLFEGDEEPESVDINLSSLTNLLLLTEREEWIKNTPDLPPDRYNKEILLQDFRELGLEIEDELPAEFKSLVDKEYFKVDDGERFFALLPSFRAVTKINAVFSKMPGLNLLAYIIQTVEEVTSNRKELDQAINQVEQTLTQNGILLSDVGPLSFDLNLDTPAQDTLPIATHSTLNKLKRCIGKQSDFPAFVSNIYDLNKKLESEYTSAAEIANVILKDVALTSNLLKLVNSAFYGQFRHGVKTVTQAVTVLGSEQVKLAAQSLMILDRMKGDAPSKDLIDSSLSSFMSGMIAKDISKNIGLMDSEESFICSMLRNIGEHFVIFHMPEENARVKSLIEDKGIDRQEASRMILGISYDELGVEIARSWNLPDNVLAGMQKPEPGEKDVCRDISNFTNQLCRISGNKKGEDREKELDKLIGVFEDALPVSKDNVNSFLESACDKVNKYSNILNIAPSQSNLLKNIKKYVRHEEDDTIIPEPSIDLEMSDDFQSVIMEGIESISELLMEDFELNNVLLMILELMFRGFQFSHVFICIINPDRRTMGARFGLGKDINIIQDGFKFNIGKFKDIFNVALANSKDIVIDNLKEPSFVSLIPKWYRYLFPNVKELMIYPIVINQIPIGLFYMDRDENVEKNSLSNQLKYLKLLRNQAILAIKQKKQ